MKFEDAFFEFAAGKLNQIAYRRMFRRLYFQENQTLANLP